MTFRFAARSRLSIVVAALLVCALSLLAAGPAQAAPGDPQYLSVTKTVDNTTPDPGESFVYTIRVTCSEASCLDAQLNDALPAELDGYTLQSAAFSPNAFSIPRTIVWTVDGTPGSAAPAVVTADTVLSVDFTGPVTAPAGTGLQNGQTFTVLLTLSVPTDLPPGTTTITNTATTSATNSADSSASAPITVTMPERVAVDATKTWSPATQGFSEGAASAISLTATSTSNVDLNKLVVQEPQAAPNGATSLAASNPFALKDFSSFTAVTLPAGATSVQVDAYTFQAGTWSWVTGTPGATAALPAGVAAADVGGLRFTFADGAITPGASAAMTLGVTQRATDRTGADLSTTSHSVTNVVVATASATGQADATDTASAPHTVTPAKVEAATSKNIAPNRMAAGETAVATIVATNNSDVPVAELRAADLNFFTGDVTFGGFASAVTWPTGTDAAKVIYHPLTGGADEEVSFATGTTPAGPSAAISGFEVVFTSATGAIVAGGSATLRFDIDTTESSLGVADSVAMTNSVTTTVTALNGVDDDATGTAGLTLVKPAIDVTLTKTMLPTTNAQPGDRVVVKLQAHLTTTSDYVTADHLEVADAWAGAGTFWDAFNLESLAPTQVPANTSMTVQVVGPDRTTTADIVTFAAQASPFLAGLTASELGDALLPTGWTAGEVTGVKISFDSVKLPGDTTVAPYLVVRARSTLRDGGAAVAVSTSSPTTYGNTASAGGTGDTPAGTPLSDTAQDVGQAGVVGSDGSGPAGISKAWSQATVPAQADARRNTTLSWSVDDGYETVTIADAQDPADPAATTYDAFDLVSISPITASATPFSNGWYLRYDTVSAVELYYSGAWHTVTEPGSGWVQNGRFVGYTLTSTESANTTGMRVVLAENGPARTAAAQAGSAYDPYAPAVGSGVASSSADRQFTLTWQLRDKTRSGSAWVTEDHTYNNGDGVVRNTATIAATPIVVGADATASANADIVINDPTPGVTVTKTVSPTSTLYVPREGSTPSSYPSATFTVTARNNSVAAASYVRLMDSPVCDDTMAIATCESPGTAVDAVADPFTPGTEWLTASGMGNPFDRFDLTKVAISASRAAEVDLDASTVWLLHYNAGVYTTTSDTATDVNAMSAADLADVVGVAVTFQGTDPATSGGTITSTNALSVTLTTKLRPTYRVSGDPQTLAANNTVTVPNRAFAQSYDPILNDGFQTGALASANARLTGGDINVGAVKSISPAALTEPLKGSTVTVTLGANQGTSPVSSLAPAEVRLTDDVTTSPEFWNTFRFTGLGTLSAPTGADQVTVSVYGPFGAGGAMEWTSSAATPFASATVPVSAAQYPDIQGVRLAFSRVDGGFFSSVVPAPSWSTTNTFTAVLRDTYYDSAAAVALAGTVHNTVTAVSDRLNGEQSAERQASSQIVLSTGTFQMKVNKLANEGTRTTSAGSSTPWDLTFTNSGTGYLTIKELRDILPASLVYLGDTAPVYTPDAGGTLGEPASMTQTGSDLVFVWPDGGGTMSPGETFSVRIMLELQPGLSSGQRATNEMKVTTAETLAACVNIDSGGATTGAWGSDPTTCGTTDYVTPNVGPNLFTVKGVRGAVDGAINPANPAQECVASLQATGGSYYRAPCAANSAMGASDSWVLRAQNAGTTGLAEMVMFDALPAPGDAYLISGLQRGSDFRPEMTDDLVVHAPTGAAVTLEVTQTPQACQGTWSGLESQEACEQNGETWSVADSATEWSAVTAFRITVDFTGTTAGRLAPGEFVDVTFTTQNVPSSAAHPDGAPVAVPVAESFAWNQFGVKYLDSGASAFRKIAPARMGVHLGVGALDVTKERVGSFVDEAPTAFGVDIACTVAGAPVSMGAYSTVALTAANSYTQRVPGLPDGSTCVVTEPDLRGAVSVSFAGPGVTAGVDQSASVMVGAAGAAISVVNHFDRKIVTPESESESEGSVVTPVDPTLALTGTDGWRTPLSAALAMLGIGVALAWWSRRRTRVS